MPELIALRAVFGQDEANYGTRRYRVGNGGVLSVPREFAVILLKNGGFALAAGATAAIGPANAAKPPPGALVTLRHDSAQACSFGGKQYQAGQNGEFLVPAAAVMELVSHGFVAIEACQKSSGQ